MGNPEFTEEYDDEHRLPLLPPGARKESHADSFFASHIEHQLFNGPMMNTAAELFNAGPVSGAADALGRLKKIQRMHSHLEGLTATLLADTVEQIGEGFSDTLAELRSDSPEEAREAERSAGYYRVDPGDEQMINSNFIAEAAIALRETPQMVSKRMFYAKGLRYVCKDTLMALAAGEITLKAARFLVKNAQDLTPEQIEIMEHILLPAAKTASDDSIYQRARRFHDRMNPESAEERHRKSEASRKVSHWIDDDSGMGTLKLNHRADVIKSIASTLRWAADQVNDPDDERTSDQLMADLYADALINGWPGSEGTPLKPRLSITIPALDMLVDPTRALADLEGVGPIPAGLALQLAQDAPSFQRVLTDPWTGAVIDVERKKYKPTQGMKDLLRHRDVHCCFPGCRRSADRSEMDHIDDWAHGGKTDRDNMHLLCKQHQMFKHALGWKIQARPDGTRSWLTPHGLHVIVTPESVDAVESLDHVNDHCPQRPDPRSIPQVQLNSDIRRVLGYPVEPDPLADSA